MVRNIGRIVGNSLNKARGAVSQTTSNLEGRAWQAGKDLIKHPTRGPIINAKPHIDKHGNAQRERLSNLYTGKKANPMWVGAIGGGGLLATSAYAQANNDIMGQTELATRNVVGSGPADIMNYDGVSNQQNSAPANLNATGDIVFGLHNQRRG